MLYLKKKWDKKANEKWLVWWFDHVLNDWMFQVAWTQSIIHRQIDKNKKNPYEIVNNERANFVHFDITNKWNIEQCWAEQVTIFHDHDDFFWTLKYLKNNWTNKNMNEHASF